MVRRVPPQLRAIMRAEQARRDRQLPAAQQCSLAATTH
jgi:hypothetical protein